MAVEIAARPTRTELLLAKAIAETCLTEEPFVGGLYCQLCGIWQNHADRGQDHADDCPGAVAQQILSR